MDLARQLDVATCVLVPLSGIVHLAAIVTLKLPGPLVLIGVLALSPPLEVIGQATLSVTGSPIQIVGDEDEYFQRPRWSPEGTRVAFTGASYRGIWVADADGSGAKSVTDDPAAGFGFTWSPDASSLLARVARYEGLRRMDAIKVFDVDSGGEELLTDFRDDMPVLPAWTHDGAHVALAPDDEAEILPATTAAGKTVSAAPLLAIRGERIVRIDPTSRVLSNLPLVLEGQPINLAASPDGSSIAFEIVGGSLMVASADGSDVVDLGRGHRPQWSPDGQWIVFQRSEDDGHVFTASDLYASRVDGSLTVRLTDTPGALEMNPSWSPDGSRIAYDDRGAIFYIAVSYR